MWISSSGKPLWSMCTRICKIWEYKVYEILKLDYWIDSPRCRNCQSDVMYYIRLILFFLIQMIVVLSIHKYKWPFGNNSNNNGNRLNCGKQSERSTFYLNIIKILVSFIQMSSVIMSYDLNWSLLVSFGFLEYYADLT